MVTRLDYPLIPSKWLIKKNIELGKKELQKLKQLRKKLKAGEKVRIYKTNSIRLFPDLKIIENDIKYYEAWIPKLKKRLAKMM